MLAITIGDVAEFYLGLLFLGACAIVGAAVTVVAVLSARAVLRRRARRTR